MFAGKFENLMKICSYYGVVKLQHHFFGGVFGGPLGCACNNILKYRHVSLQCKVGRGQILERPFSSGEVAFFLWCSLFDSAIKSDAF